MAPVCKQCGTNKCRPNTAYGTYRELCSSCIRKPYLAYRKESCEECGFVPKHLCQLDVDHVDGNHANNDPDNLRTLCANCHRLKTHLCGDNLKAANDEVAEPAELQHALF